MQPTPLLQGWLLQLVSNVEVHCLPRATQVSFLTAALMGVALCFHSVLEVRCTSMSSTLMSIVS